MINHINNYEWIAVIVIANYLYDRGVPFHISRKLSHYTSGVGFLICITCLGNPYWVIAILICSSIVILLARKIMPEHIRGMSHKKPTELYSCILFVPVLFIGAIWAARPSVAIASILFLTWGDAAAGVIRSWLFKHPTKHWFGSLVMFIVCFGVVLYFVRPVWVGVIGSLVATLTEWAFGSAGVCRKLDDNIVIPAASLASMLIILTAIGASPLL
jgi:dolichol kinase